MKLTELLNIVKYEKIIGEINSIGIGDITNDSRNVDENSIFVAIKGLKQDGHKYISKAVENGCKVIVFDNEDYLSENKQEEDLVYIKVENSRITLSEFSNKLFGEPSKKLKLIGITGTKGKTTSTFFIKSMLENCGFKVGLIGTIANYIGDEKIDSNLTTPEANTLNRLLKQMVESGCKYCVMEVSSHSLELFRVMHLDFDYAFFTNIASDHLDYHKTFENYRNAKKKLFDGLKPNAKAILNADDENWKEIVKDSNAEVFSYGQDKNADFHIESINYNLDGTEYKVLYNQNRFELRTSLIGNFNAYNSIIGFMVAVLEEFSIDKAIEGIENTKQVPGRFEVITESEKKIIVDYSHTADSLEKALSAIKHVNKDNYLVYTVMGCGGDRDKTKRPVMGNIAERLSDHLIVTSDNPRTEDPFEIISDILAGLEQDKHIVIEDREKAIIHAVTESPDKAVILIAGKGHETYQEIDGVKNYFSDKEVAQKAMDMIK